MDLIGRFICRRCAVFIKFAPSVSQPYADTGTKKMGFKEEIKTPPDVPE